MFVLTKDYTFTKQYFSLLIVVFFEKIKFISTILKKNFIFYKDQQKKFEAGQ